MAITNILDLFRSKSPTSLVTMPEEAPMMSLAAPLTEDVPQTGPQMSIPSTEPVSSAPVVNEVSPVESTPAVEVAPVTYQATTPHVSAFDPRAWSQPTADFFEAYTAGTAGSDFLKNYREIQGARADQEYKRLIANAQMLNALKQTNGLGTVGKEFRDLAAVFGEDRAREMLAQSYEKGRGGVNISLGDKSMETRTKVVDEQFGKQLFEAAPVNPGGSDIDVHRSLVKRALSNGQLDYAGRLGAESVYKLLTKFGFLSAETEQALQALNTYSAFERAANLRKIVGGGQVSNIEQQLATVALPGLDKTKDQLMMMITASEGLDRVTDTVYSYMLSEYQKGTPTDQIRSAGKKLYEKEMRALYSSLGLDRTQEGTKTPNKTPKRVTKVIKGKNVTLEEGPDGNYYPVR